MWWGMTRGWLAEWVGGGLRWGKERRVGEDGRWGLWGFGAGYTSRREWCEDIDGVE